MLMWSVSSMKSPGVNSGADHQRVADQKLLYANNGQGTHSKSRCLDIVAFIVVRPAGQHCNGFALKLADNQIAGMSCDGRSGKANFSIRANNRICEPFSKPPRPEPRITAMDGLSRLPRNCKMLRATFATSCPAGGPLSNWAVRFSMRFI